MCYKLLVCECYKGPHKYCQYVTRTVRPISVANCPNELVCIRAQTYAYVILEREAQLLLPSYQDCLS